MRGENRGRKPKIEFISIIENEIIKFKHEIVQDGNSKIYIILINIITDYSLYYNSKFKKFKSKYVY